MAEIMLFPKTWEEFEKHYGFYDSKQAYMYGNARLIPSFRVEQWLDHIDDIKRKKQLQKNKMEQVAALFGQQLGKEFRVKDLITGKIYVASFCNYGMRAYVEGFPHSEKPRWDMIMRLILGGSAVIVDD